MITTADLKTQTRRDLAEMARQLSVSGWHGMRKDQLIDALRKVQRQTRRRAKQAEKKLEGPEATPSLRSGSKASVSKSRSTNRGSQKTNGHTGKKATPRSSNGSSHQAISRAANGTTQRSAKLKGSNKKSPAKPTKPNLSRQAREKLRQRQEILDRNRDLSLDVLVARTPSSGMASEGSPDAHVKDRAVLLVRDSYWLQVCWEITRASVERAQAAMAEHWHTARPVLRLMSVGSDAAGSNTEQLQRDIPIHGGVNTWYIDVLESPARFRVVIGYISEKGRFYPLCRSNVVETPEPNACDPIEGHWQDIADDYQRIYSLSGGCQQAGNSDLRELFESRLKRPMPHRDEQGFSDREALALDRERELPFVADAELIVYGKTVPDASVSLAGEPVRLQPDGTFTVRMELPDRRQVLPVTAISKDGMRQRTTVIAVERNTKVMEPYNRQDDDR